MINNIIIDNIIKNALMEDINYIDITTDNLIEDSHISKGNFLAKEDGIICGIEIAKRVFFILDEKIEFHVLRKDGEFVKKGDIIATVEGNTKNLLKGERTSLNIIQRLSGIATKTNKIVNLVKEYNIKIVDTRKTTPNLRVLEKYAVKIGGGYNHRYNLSESVMIKDNHIKVLGSIKEAVNKIREKIGHTVKVELEVKNLDELKEALDLNVDIILLDNMSIEEMKQAVKINNGKSTLEASGNIDEENIVDVAKTGVNVISMGALTHSFRSLDISMKII
ncbi:carboxylating nicotinate-nucleotide diphosphorylase [Tepidibacter formicigenes]|jgi:nicotinate-nucleotide pyrophosphorylase (carboxylating)|uniref:Probable nicotinate-nucleotide pyrophosphorylase [carboxylating] n=1 Tax=Tepidibacter formicigenes DSM 15518 TaxID=1123349 RepID=A0A1M6QB87_9FIRM|nr:carboxylating nicotinate-nucleotide diphosphorylase [Tepidibacter formicigenes]SHK17400.1 nicotinate-nucleotide pyrophosphorylase [carboxylating] [Tepidibacter formicigenes DSM 15518]